MKFFYDVPLLPETGSKGSKTDILMVVQNFYFLSDFDLLKSKNTVISLGGGAFLNNTIRRNIKKLSISFWLDVPIDELVKRLKKNNNRPLLFNKNIGETVKKIYFERKKIYNEADKSKILEFKKKKIQIIKSKINTKKRFDLKVILKRLYKVGCRNILVEGGNELTNSFLQKKFFNLFYLFKSPRKLSKLTEFKEFNGFNILKQNYKNKLIINSNLRNDTITLYKK